MLATPFAAPALAQEGTLTMGLSVTPSSFDPQLGALGSDETYYSHVYDALFMRSPNLQPVPKLATGYTLVDDLTWEIDLREGVTFHDGSAFDADDVLFTLERLPTVEGSDGLNTEKMAPITNVEVLSPHKIRVTTDVPVPNFISQLFTIFIISDELDPGVTTADFNDGTAAIGTGPYRFVEWRQGEEVVLEANEDYFDGAPAFERVVLREMPNDGSRVAALLAGDVDFIDAVPPLDVGRLRDADGVSVVSGPSARVIFIQFQSDPAPHPDVTDASGTPLDPNPLSVPGVRQALAAAVDQDLIADRIMDGLATPATQAVPAGFLGHADDLEDAAGDAAAMLAEAGYPDGFALTLSCPNDRYVNDAAICQAVGQMFTRAGVQTTVDTMPRSAYFTPMREGEFGAWMLGWGNSQGHAGSVLPSVFRSGGSWNGGTLIDAADPMIDESIAVMDTDARGEAMAEAMRLLSSEAAYVPLHAQAVIVALREGLDYTIMADETSLAVNVTTTD
ncbi:ABC transporter substrate-binding protein [Jannaschia sp. LMIT008]|uniref:ABC transporter substrate-binding protein n=1 Tax=Jannaschia maritima TaxID=3032585 RepID=UPI00281183B8|nr:ABC transporter substrate-binding protein [Jannaschia sp. LMIT008]